MSVEGFVPTRDGRFEEWAGNLYGYVVDNYTRWSVPSPDGILKKPLEDFQEAYEKLADPNHGKVDVEHKKETRKSCEQAFRLYVRAYLQPNPAVTDEDRVAMDIPVHKTTKTKRSPPETTPELEVDTGTLRVHKVHYRDKGSSHRGKPEGVAGIEIRWAVLDRYPESIEELVHSGYDTASPWENRFDESDRGKKIYYCGRWEIPSEGEKGDFGEIVEAIVP
jgi:hypothetical protein